MSAIICPLCASVMALHSDGHCPIESFEDAMVAIEDEVDMDVTEIPGVFMELLMLARHEDLTGDRNPLDDRLCEMTPFDLALMLRQTVGIVHAFIVAGAEMAGEPIDETLSSMGLELATGIAEIA